MEEPFATPGQWPALQVVCAPHASKTSDEIAIAAHTIAADIARDLAVRFSVEEFDDAIGRVRVAQRYFREEGQRKSSIAYFTQGAAFVAYVLFLPDMFRHPVLVSSLWLLSSVVLWNGIFEARCTASLADYCGDAIEHLVRGREGARHRK